MDSKITQDSQPLEWTCSRGWKASLSEGIKPIALLGLGTSIATVMGGFIPILLPIMVPTGLICTLAIPIVHAYYANKHLLNPGFRRLEPSRRLFLRWGGRIAFGNLIAMVYAPASLFSVIVSPLAFAAFISVQKRLLDMQLYRQEQNLPLTIVEKFALGLLATISIGVFMMLILIAGALGLSVEWIIDWYNTDGQVLLQQWGWIDPPTP